jgi:hypothetical protein
MADPQALFIVTGIVLLALLAFVVVALTRASDEPPRPEAKKEPPKDVASAEPKAETKVDDKAEEKLDEKPAKEPTAEENAGAEDAPRAS